MKPKYGVLGICLVGMLTAGADTAHAAWDNVFQVTCHSCDKRGPIRRFFSPRVARAAPASDCCPQVVQAPPTDCCPPPTVTYRPRCELTPVTTYRRTYKMEPVTTMRRSYKYEPVTTVRYTSYYDPCTGCCRRKACPVTTYRLKAECNPVTSYVQRCEIVPVTSYRRTYRMERVVTPSPCCDADPCADGGVAPAPVPGITEEATPRSIPPTIEEGFGEEGSTLPPMDLPPGVSRRSEPPRATPEPPRAPVPARIDRIASFSEPRLQGRVVSRDRATPDAGARIIFVNANRQTEKERVVADNSGHFEAELPAGDWLMYLADGRGKAVYHSRVSLKPNDNRLVTVVGR